MVYPVILLVPILLFTQPNSVKYDFNNFELIFGCHEYYSNDYWYAQNFYHFIINNKTNFIVYLINRILYLSVRHIRANKKNVDIIYANTFKNICMHMCMYVNLYFYIYQFISIISVHATMKI